MDHEFYQKTCSSMSSPWGHRLLQVYPPWATGGYLLFCWSPWAPFYRSEQTTTPWHSSWAAGESLHWYLEHLLPLLQWPWSLQGFFSHTFSLPFLSCSCAAFLPFLKYVSTGMLPISLIVSALVCLGDSWKWFCLTLEQLLVSSHRSCFCSSPTTKTLPCKPIYINFHSIHIDAVHSV